MTTENLEQNKGPLVAMSKVVGATTAMLSGLEAGLASRAAENAVENNLLPLLAVAGSGVATLGGGAATIGIGTQTAIAVGAGILTAVGLNALINKDSEGETQSTNTTQGAASSGGGMPGDEDPEGESRKKHPNEPQLPPKTVVKDNGVEIKHYTRSGDHAPAHLHVRGRGPEVRVGQNGKPLKGQPELTRQQKDVVEANIKTIRKAVKQMQKWHKHQQNY